MDDPQLVAAYYTLAGRVYPGTDDTSPFAFRRRADAAAAAGYYGIGVSGFDLASTIDRIGHKGISTILQDTGLRFFEIECLMDWFADGPNREASDAMRAVWLQAAAEIGIDHFKVVGDMRKSGVSVSRMAGEFGILCAQAAAHGVKVSLEIFPDANLCDLKTGRELMDLLDLGATPNGGLLVDIWHMMRKGVSYDEIAALPPGYIAHVEIDDAAETMEGGFFEDTSMRRLLPGEGSFDIPAFLRATASGGYHGPIGVEILSETMRAMEPEEAARKSFDAAMRQFR